MYSCQNKKNRKVNSKPTRLDCQKKKKCNIIHYAKNRTRNFPCFSLFTLIYQILTLLYPILNFARKFNWNAITVIKYHAKNFSLIADRCIKSTYLLTLTWYFFERKLPTSGISFSRSLSRKWVNSSEKICDSSLYFSSLFIIELQVTCCLVKWIHMKYISPFLQNVSWQEIVLKQTIWTEIPNTKPLTIVVCQSIQ